MKTRAVEWPTLLLLGLTYLVWVGGTLIWAWMPMLAVSMIGLAVTQQSSLQHEALHGHPFAHEGVNEALVFPALSLFIPYRRFRDLHLQHHYDPALTDPYDDPESNYQDPAEWARLGAVWQGLLRVNNTLAGRIVLGPIIGTGAFVTADMRAIWRGDRAVRGAWVAHLPGAAMVLVWLWGVGMPLWAYLLAVYLGVALLKIRTFLEHRAHEAARARTVVVEDRGPLSLLFLNNNFHVVHHMHPQVPWYELPGLYAARKAHYQARNEGYVYRSYAHIFRQYLWRAKDPVPHPVWPVRKQGSDQAAEGGDRA